MARLASVARSRPAWRAFGVTKRVALCRCSPLYQSAKDFTQFCASAFVANPLGGQFGRYLQVRNRASSMRVVVADARTTIGRGDTQLFHCYFHALPGNACFHAREGAAIVGVQHRRARRYSFRPALPAGLGQLPGLHSRAHAPPSRQSCEPPLVYRRVICSTIRRPYRVCSSLHRTPPLLLRG